MKCIECEICGKKFYDRGQKYKPQYQLLNIGRVACDFLKKNNSGNARIGY